MNSDQKLVIYQLFPRVFTNSCENPVPWGTLEQNGSGHLKDISPKVLDSIRELGVNCIWLTGVIEHATKTDFSSIGITPDNPNVVKGEAGSPYAIKDYYDVDPAIASDPVERMKEFEKCVKTIHKSGMKVIIDFVPNHTARCYHSDVAPEGVRDFGVDDDKTMCFSPSNNYYYITNQQFCPDFSLHADGTDPYIEFPAKATGNDCFNAFCHATDWYETVKLNYGHDYGDNTDHFYPVPSTWKKMLDILCFWASKGIDGFRCDMVFMVPLAFWNWVIPQVKAKYPHLIFIGEIYDVALYRSFLSYGCFDYLYDKVGLYDTLVGIERFNYSAARITGCWQAIDGIGDSMLNFLENHDEVRYASRELAGDPRKVVPSLVVSSMISKGPFMLYYGQELGEPALDNEGFAGDNNRTTIFDYWSLDTLRRWYDGGKCSKERLTPQERWLRSVYADVLTCCNKLSAVRNGDFFDLMYVNLDNPRFNPHSHFAFLRHDENQVLLIVANFGGDPSDIEVRIPSAAFEVAGISEGETETNDILWGRSQRFTLSPDGGVTLRIGARDAIVVPLPKKVNK